LDSIPFIGIMRMRRGVATVKIGIEIRVCRASSRSAPGCCEILGIDIFLHLLAARDESFTECVHIHPIDLKV